MLIQHWHLNDWSFNKQYIMTVTTCNAATLLENFIKTFNILKSFFFST